MKPDDFQYLSRLLRERSGLVIGEDKGYLLENRLVPVARNHGLKDLDELVGALRAGGREALVGDVVDAMTTNESFFFRDKKPFDQFVSLVLPHLIKTRAASRSFRIWSAAASSGQEPYSVAMLLREHAAKLSGWRYEIVATDISRDILAKAKAGIYSQFEVQRGLPISLLVKYFKQDGERWQIDPAIRAMVQFREFNLLDDPRILGSFDVVFCRNVLIYFDQQTKARVLERIRQVMPDDGFLYLGGAETVLGITDRFQPFPAERGIYAVSAAAAQARAAV
ncbi:MAG TPA: protein-glutamate O-methyltransferase [Alphaproteobacteria bacterium]|nr:protein-glutamate O-methyltransferase [Alphaproteobacteria bacterium]